jgi:hypothetical protein
VQSHIARFHRGDGNKTVGMVGRDNQHGLDVLLLFEHPVQGLFTDDALAGVAGCGQRTGPRLQIYAGQKTIPIPVCRLLRP